MRHATGEHVDHPRRFARAARWVLPASALLVVEPSSAEACTSVRPTDDPAGFSFDGAPTTSFAEPGDPVRVHYATEGTHVPLGFGEAEPPEGVRLAREAALAASLVFSDLGFDAPVSDATLACTNGGDGLVDLYLLHFPGADGHAGRDECDEASDTTACSGFLVVENDFQGLGYPSAEAGYQIVVPHEYFHLVQAAYAPSMPDFWSEGTAQWAAKHVYPEQRDLESYLPAYFERPNRPIDLPPSTGAQPFSYGAAIWPVFLEEAFGLEVVRETFERMRVEPDPLVAVDQVLQTRDSSLADAWAIFALFNAATGSRTGSVGYGDAARYPLVPTEPLSEQAPFVYEGVTSGLSATYFELPEGELRTVRIETGEASRGFVVPLEAGAAQIEAAAEGHAEVEGRALVVIAGVTPSLQDAPFTIDVAVGRVEVASEPEPEPEPEPTRADAGSRGTEAASRPKLAGESGCGFVQAGRSSTQSVVALVWLLCCALVGRRRRGSKMNPVFIEV
jgi:hypothetical protein